MQTTLLLSSNPRSTAGVLLLTIVAIEYGGWFMLRVVRGRQPTTPFQQAFFRALAIQPDHIHVFVRVWPSDSAADVVKALKGVTSFFLRKEFRVVTSKLPSLWTRSYFASTAGNDSKETIQHYIEAQKEL
jgi:putative transposase